VEVFADTSGLYALLDAADAAHKRATERWDALEARGAMLVTHAHVVVEASAVVQRRLGFEHIRSLAGILRFVKQVPVEEAVHDEAFKAFLTVGSRSLSLVDCTSFVFMRRRNIEEALAFDRHFEAHGFRTK